MLYDFNSASLDWGNALEVILSYDFRYILSWKTAPAVYYLLKIHAQNTQQREGQIAIFRNQLLDSFYRGEFE